MGKKAEVGTPKYLANKMKAKGLQKLRWYCQMCQKQCRDENGFKCHTMSESHQRQLLLFGENSKRYIDDFSFDFAKGYISILKRQFGSKRVNANKVYQEYISDKNHVHMNGTRWVTLSGFVKWLGKTGQAVIEEESNGWFITYIDRSPETVEAEERKKKKQKMDRNDEEKTILFIEKQIKAGLEKSKPEPESVYTELVRDNEEEPLKLNLQIKSENKIPESLPTNSKMLNKSVKLSIKPKIESRLVEKRKTSLDEIKEMEESKREKKNRKDNWITEGIIVKVITKSLGEEYYKQKGVIKEVVKDYGAIIKLLNSGKKLKLDQQHLETVIPAIGKLVKIVNGAYRGEIAKLVSINEKEFCVNVEIEKGLLKGRVVKNVIYEDISKLDDS